MTARLRRVWIVAKVEVVDQLTAPWFYVILVGLVLIVRSFAAPAVDPLVLVSNAASGAEPHPILAALSEEGYAVEVGTDARESRERVLRGKATFAVRIEPGERVEVHHFHPRTRLEATALVEERTLDLSTRAFGRFARRRGVASPEMPLAARGVLGERPTGDETVLRRGIAALWAILVFFAMATHALAREGMRRILRTYTLGEFFAGRLLAGMLLGTGYGAAALAAILSTGLRLERPAALALAMPLAVASAVTFGLFCALVPRTITRRAPDDLFGALTLAGVGDLFLTLFAGVVFPTIAIPPALRAVTEWLPPGPAIEIAVLSALGGMGIEAPPVRDALVHYAGSLAALVAIDLALLRRA